MQLKKVKNSNSFYLFSIGVYIWTCMFLKISHKANSNKIKKENLPFNILFLYLLA